VDWFKVYSDGILRGSLATSDSDTQLLWLKLLAMANETRQRDGCLQFAPGLPMTREYIASVCHTTVDKLNKALEIYQHEIGVNNEPRVIIKEDGTISLTNWRVHQSPKTPARKPPTEKAKDAMFHREVIMKQDKARETLHKDLGDTIVTKDGELYGHLPDNTHEVKETSFEYDII